MERYRRKALALCLAALMLLTAGCGGHVGETPASTEPGESPTAEESRPETTQAPTETEPQETEPEEEPDPYAVSAPTRGIPDYTFDHTPTTDELRQTAVRAMRDMLAIQWYSPEDFKYNKTGAVSGKDYIFDAHTHYGGLPYTDVNASLFGFLEYYDQANGQLLLDLIRGTSTQTGARINATIGNTCTGSTGWATSAVCTSVGGGMISYTLTKSNGFLPLGFDYPSNVYDLSAYGTHRMCNEATEQGMYRCYALVQPADLLVMQNENKSAGHSIMAIEKAYVVQDEAGNISGEDSYILIQDQRTGFYDLDDEAAPGEIIRYMGRLAYRFTFDQLFKGDYVPVTTAEYQGTKAYTVPEVALKNGEAADLETLYANAVTCNYPLAVVRLTAVAPNGERTVLVRRVMNRNDIGGRSAYEFKLSSFKGYLEEGVKKGLLYPGTAYQVVLEAIPACGGLNTLVTLDYETEGTAPASYPAYRAKEYQPEEPAVSEEEKNKSAALDGKLYWYTERSYFNLAKNASDQKPDASGVYTVKMISDGQLLSLKTKYRYVVDALVMKNLFCLGFDADGYIVRVEDALDQGAAFAAIGWAVEKAESDQLTLTAPDGSAKLTLDLKTVKVLSGAQAADPVGTAENSFRKGDTLTVLKNAKGEAALALLLAKNMTHEHCLCGEENCSEHESGQWKAWNSGNTLPEEAGWYYLTQDVSLPTRASVKAGAHVRLCLNGHTVKVAAGARCYSVYADGAVLDITDCSAEGSGRILPCGTFASNLRGCAILVGHVKDAKVQPVLNIYGGIIDGSESYTSYCGTILIMDGNTVNMYGGTVIGGHVSEQGGGTIYVSAGGSFNMYGGTLKGGDATGLKGGTVLVKNGGKMLLAGGTVGAGIADKPDNSSIYAERKSDFTQTGGTVEGGIAFGN